MKKPVFATIAHQPHWLIATTIKNTTARSLMLGHLATPSLTFTSSHIKQK